MNAERTASNRVRSAIEQLRSDSPQLEAIYTAFEELLAVEADVREESRPDQAAIDRIQDQPITDGVPRAAQDFPVPDTETFKEMARRLIPAMSHGLPNLTAELEPILAAIEDGRITPDVCMNTALGRATDELNALAEPFDVQPEFLRFVCGRLVKAWAEKTASLLGELPEGAWTKGYCPVCGSWPDLSVIEGVEGQRKLHCSFCGYKWRFNRLMCPACETEDMDSLEVIFHEDRTHERAELCHKCRRYVLSQDIRNVASQPPPHVAAMGMVYLDIIAQEKGFNPIAPTLTNAIE